MIESAFIVLDQEQNSQEVINLDIDPYSNEKDLETFMHQQAGNATVKVFVHSIENESEYTR